MKTRSLNSSFMLRGPQVVFAPDDGVVTPPSPAPAPAAETPAVPADTGVSAAPSDATPEDISAILHFDPFAEPSAPTPPVPPAPPMAAASASPPAEPVTPPEAPTVAADPVVAELQKIRDQLATPAPAATPAAPAAPEPEPDNYFEGIAVPPALVNAIRSDDPNEVHNAVNILVQGAANLAYKKAREELGKFIREGLPQFMGSFQTQVQTARTIYEDFYGTFKELNKPELYPLVQSVAQQMIQVEGQGFKGWTPDFRDKVGRAVVSLIAGVTGTPAAPTPPTPQPFQPSGGARPAAVPDASNEIMSTLFG